MHRKAILLKVAITLILSPANKNKSVPNSNISLKSFVLIALIPATIATVAPVATVYRVPALQQNVPSDLQFIYIFCYTAASIAREL